MKPFDASMLRDRITFQQETLTADGLGGGVRSYEDIVTVWAEVTPLTTSENTGGNGIESSTTYRIRTRWREGITPALRILYDTRILAITGVHDDASHHQYLLITAREGGVL